ncbi:MAG TPA: hypothetical protein VG433_17265, partial [Pirellulales bacterium]|nr:hypothetical protein [Pirellulales bacterium]
MLHRHQNFCHAGKSGRFERVTDVRFHAAQRDALAIAQLRAEKAGQRLDLGCIAHFGAGGMGLDELNMTGIDAGSVG